MRILQHFRRRGESGDNLILSLSEFRFSHLAVVVYIIFLFVNTDFSQTKVEPRRRWSVKTWSCDGPATDASPPPPPASG